MYLRACDHMFTCRVFAGILVCAHVCRVCVLAWDVCALSPRTPNSGGKLKNMVVRSMSDTFHCCSFTTSYFGGHLPKLFQPEAEG